MDIPEELINELKRSIRHDNFWHEGGSLTIEVDRYRRHDHGGGDDGDDWLDEYEIDKDRDQGEKEHKGKLERANSILEQHGYKPNAYFELGEKGHFSIQIVFKKKN